MFFWAFIRALKINFCNHTFKKIHLCKHTPDKKKKKCSHDLSGVQNTGFSGNNFLIFLTYSTFPLNITFDIYNKLMLCQTP
jgi:hypothetical protein